jgi:hypothetical protein
MAGPAYYTAVVNIAKNEDWVVPFIYGTPSADGTTVIPIDLTGSVLKMQLRVNETDHEALVSAASPDDGIAVTDGPNGAFTILLDRASRLIRLADGQQYFVDLVRLMPTGLQERLFEGVAYVVEGTTR